VADGDAVPVPVTVGNSRSPGTLNRNEWAVLKGAGSAGNAPATPTGCIPVGPIVGYPPDVGVS